MMEVKNCLLIDDDKDDQEIFIMSIGKISNNINCLAIDNGIDAISMLTSNVDYTPDYIFLDVNMPKMKGIDCLKELKKIDRLKDTKIFMYSTTAERHTVYETEKLGASGFIIKPSTIAELRQKLYDILNAGA